MQRAHGPRRKPGAIGREFLERRDPGAVDGLEGQTRPNIDGERHTSAPLAALIWA
jgi:hypothetical protein